MTDRQPPNYRDDACGFGHSAHAPDVAGTLFGLRGWDLTDDGYLRGATYRVAWGAGWNTAACLVARDLRDPMAALPRRPRYGHPFWGAFHDANSGCLFPAEPGEPVEFEDGWAPDPCKGLDPKCGCGFYGYYDQQSGRASGYGNIRGVIEATGKCVVGPKGFRAQRARIVGIVRPSNFKPRLSGIKKAEVDSLHATVKLLDVTRKDLRLHPWFGGTNKFGILWGTCVLTLALLGNGASDRGALLGAVATTLSLTGILTWASRRRTRRLMVNLDTMIAEGKQQIADLTADVDLDEVLALVHEHYPDVKVYPSMAALIADYPPSDVRGLLDIEFTQGGDQ